MAGYVAVPTKVPTKLRRFRAVNTLNYLSRKDDISAHVAGTINDLYELSQEGQKPANRQFALKYIPESRSPKKIEDDFRAFVQAILKLLKDLFCTLGECTADSILIDLDKQVEVCVLHFEPYSPGPT